MSDFIRPQAICEGCGCVAKWQYAGDERFACDDCIPRGCSCNTNQETGQVYREEDGRELPCVDWNEVAHVYRHCEELLDAVKSGDPLLIDVAVKKCSGVKVEPVR